jgi:hypothetical protein
MPPQGEELVIRIGEGPTVADHDETRVTVFREDHTAHPLLAFVQHVTHAPWVPSGRPGTIGSYCGDVGGPSRHRPGGPSVWIGQVVFPGAVGYFRVGSPLPLWWRLWVRLR